MNERNERKEINKTIDFLTKDEINMRIIEKLTMAIFT